MGCSSSTPAASKSSNPAKNQRHSIGNHLISKHNADYTKDYDVVGHLGEGAFGRVVKVRSKKDKQLYAVKLIELGKAETTEAVDDDVDDQELEYSLRNELNLLRSLDHPSVVKIYGLYENNNPAEGETSSLAIVLELCTGGDLYTREPYTEAQAMFILAKILEGTHYLHSKKIIHRDLKHENVLFEDTSESSQIKLVDFGLSRKSLRKVIPGKAGTLYTMAPEACRGESDRKSDLWSIGVIAFMLLSGGEKPFYGQSRVAMVKNISAGISNESFSSPAWKGVSDDAKTFVKHLLQVDLEKRYNTQEALDDPWIQRVKSAGIHDLSESVVLKIGTNFQTFSSTSEFQKLALQAVAKRSNSEEIAKLREAFLAMDPDRTGVITLANMKKAMGSQYSNKEVERLFRAVDVDDTGTISYTEFLAAALSAHDRMEEQRIALAFDVFDPNETGHISRRDLREILGAKADSGYVDRLVAEADKNGDGKISYQEFKLAFDRETLQSKDSFRKSLKDLGTIKETASGDTETS